MKDIEDKLADFSKFLSHIDASDLSAYKDRFFQHIDGIAEDLKNAPNRQEIEEKFYQICSQLEVSPIHRRCREKPLGYSGDYRVIDWIYTQKMAETGEARLFDQMFHIYEGAEAVRNRKDWFVKKCVELAKAKKSRFDILDLGCGPCRDILEAYENCGNGKHIRFHCVDHEPEAIAYARELLKEMVDRGNVTFNCTNVFRLKTKEKYDLIWSAGLFDYLDDRIAGLLIKKSWRYLREGGQFIFGNFSPRNPAREGMGLALKWYLIHRTADDLLRLVNAAGVPFKEIEIESESLGVNLFCVIKK